MLVYFFLLLAANVGENIEKSEVGEEFLWGKGGVFLPAYWLAGWATVATLH